MNKEIIQTLDKILPVVERVHGDHHPELHRVAQLYAQLRNAPAQSFSRSFARRPEITPSRRTRVRPMKRPTGSLKNWKTSSAPERRTGDTLPCIPHGSFYFAENRIKNRISCCKRHGSQVIIP